MDEISCDTNAGPRLVNSSRIGYVVKRYPRFSETFIVNEILAHEKAGLDIEIFSLKPCIDTHFQNVISQVKAPVTWLSNDTSKLGTFWRMCHRLAKSFPQLWTALSESQDDDETCVAQAMELAMTVRERKIEHLHAHFATSAATVARLAAEIAGIDYSVTMHAKDIFHESVVEEDLQRKISQAKFVVTVSDFNHQYLVSKFGAVDKIHRIYNGLDLELFGYQPEGLRSRKIVAVGRLVAKKGFKFLVEACRELADRGVPFECEIIGNGELENALRRQVMELGLQNQVRLLGPQPQNRVRELIRQAAILAAPCIIGDDGNRDGLPTVITEAMALGTPCIATDVTGIPEIVRHLETGWIVPQENPFALANELHDLLDNEPLRRRFSMNGRRLVEREFDVHKNVANLRSLFSGKNQRVKPSQISKFQRA